MWSTIDNEEVTLTTQKDSRQDRLAKVRDKLAKTDFGGSGNYWKPKQGRNIIRILPGVGDMEDFFWQDVGKHYPPDSNRSFVCREFTLGEPCPICEFVQELYDAGDEASKTLAGKIRCRKQFWMNIIDRANEDKGPQIFTPGPMIFKQVASLIGDPDYGEIYDEYEGLDLIISRTGTGLDTEYDVNSRRKESPLADNDDIIDEWLDAAKDLSVVELSDNPAEDRAAGGGDAVVFVLSYERLESEFTALDVEGDPKVDLPFPEDDNDSKRTRRAVVGKRAGRTRSRSSARRR